MEIWKNPKNIIFWIFIILFFFSVLLGFIAILIKISYKKAIEKKQLLFNEKIKHEQNLKKSIIKVQDEERKKIASELHDQVSNKLNLVLLKLNNLKQEQDTDSVNQIKQEIRNVLDKNRDISHYLFPVEIENIGIISTLQDLAIKYSNAQFRIRIIYDENIVFTDIQTEVQLYRVIQETLTNTLKYSQATIFSISFRKFKNQLFILINDNGIGFDPVNTTKGIGLTGIETRLNSINARYKIKSSSRNGTRLIVMI